MNVRPRGIRVTFWLIALVLGGLQAWAGRFPIGEDGLSYLDIADAYLRGDWHNAISAYWSPLYSWLLAVALGLTRPAPFWESSVVHATNFLLFVCALASFEFLLRQLVAVHRSRQDAAGAQGDVRLSESALLALAYSLFIWASINWIDVSLDTPDLCLTIFVFLATGVLLRMRTHQPSSRTFFVFGVILGLAYLTKFVMLPLSVVFLALIFVVDGAPRAWRGVAVAVVALVLVAGPYVLAMSIVKGRFTTSDTGRIAYVLFANGATDRERHWFREFPDDQRPVHPTRKVFEHPALYEFGSDPVGGAYPIWYDPSYWHEGETPHFDLSGQIRVLRWSAIGWWRLFVTDGYFVVFGAFILLSVAFRRWTFLLQELAANMELIVPCVAALGAYSVVLFSPRYVAVFVVLMWIGIFASVRLSDSWPTRRLAWSVPVAIVLMLALRMAPVSVSLVRDGREHRGARAHMFWQIAEGLRQLGAKPGDKIAGIGYGPPAYWARLAGVRIVAEMFSEDLGFPTVPGIEKALEADGSLTPQVVNAFAGTGAKYVVARRPPQSVVRHGWRELGEGTNWYGYVLPQ